MGWVSNRVVGSGSQVANRSRNSRVGTIPHLVGWWFDLFARGVFGIISHWNFTFRHTPPFVRRVVTPAKVSRILRFGRLSGSEPLQDRKKKTRGRP